MYVSSPGGGRGCFWGAIGSDGSEYSWRAPKSDHKLIEKTDEFARDRWSFVAPFCIGASSRGVSTNRRRWLWHLPLWADYCYVITSHQRGAPMKPFPPHAEATLSGPENFSEQQTAFRFDEARAHVRNAVRCAEADGISSETLALALIGEALPPIVHKHGPIWAATVLMKLARRLNAGL